MDEVTVDQTTRRSKKRQRTRSYPATSCGICFLFIYLIVIAISSVAFGYFIFTDLEVTKHEEDKCLLFAKRNHSDLELSDRPVCDFFRYGVSGVMILQVVLVVIAICNTLWGKWLVYLKIYELMILTVSIFLCLAAATVLSMGYSITCDEQKHLDTENEKLCRKLKLPDTHIDYGYRLLFIEVSIWLVLGLLILAFLVKLFVSLCLCCCTTSKRRQDDWFDERVLLKSRKGKRYL